MGRTTADRSALAATPVVPATHLLSVNVSSHVSSAPHRPSQGWRSQSPVLGLQAVPAVQIAMQPPAARFAAAAPSAIAVVTAAPAPVLTFAVLQETSSAAV